MLRATEFLISNFYFPPLEEDPPEEENKVPITQCLNIEELEN